ncbi:type II toxin-antitoxin system RelE/ParE family toxin [Paraglaciecola sp. MB-3u-78]|uniref:type II toxin-antitoxin system RelE/ParE family toxin n=1 Tax=Paraglaciecola sp. MB-3u-78 TaxID=2058332 RepID=UPI000C338D05|nr:type II toxin-antitoxin system RelE/ParE family toxin [Paraglaciecola sp. MB-3u-78]PKG93379.1 plasmid maintenance system killer [Paraglaciecola sp. MB-3u-78]
MAIKSFSHKGLKKLFYKGDSSGIQPIHTDKLVIMLDIIQASHYPKDMKAIYGPKFREKVGSGAGVYSVDVSGNWRVTFEIEDDGAVLLDYRDYHGKQIKAKK